MTTLMATLAPRDLLVILAVVLAFIGGTAFSKGPSIELLRLELQVRDLQKKMDALLKHQGIVMPPPPASGLSPEVERLASDPNSKIAAIKLCRLENPGLGLREAKLKIEEFYNSRR